MAARRGGWERFWEGGASCLKDPQPFWKRHGKLGLFTSRVKGSEPVGTVSTQGPTQPPRQPPPKPLRPCVHVAHSTDQVLAYYPNPDYDPDLALETRGGGHDGQKHAWKERQSPVVSCVHTMVHERDSVCWCVLLCTCCSTVSELPYVVIGARLLFLPQLFHPRVLILS